MDLNRLESVLRAQGDWPEYAAFFGLLALFGLLELRLARDPRAPARARRWTTNGALTVLNILVLASLPLGGVLLADWAQWHGVGLLNALDVAPLAALVIGFLLRSLISYGTHVAMHKVPWFWRVHRVHHTDTRIDVSSTVRFHPAEFLISVPINLTLIALLGIPPVALLLYEILDAGMAVFTHANVRLPKWLDRGLRALIVTPDMHRIHHSAWQAETDSNFGATLSIWDRVFGTYRATPHRPFAELPLGLAEVGEGEASSLPRQLVLPFVTPPRERPA
jgi:sterol desaturase/sphingolipid hydroxylase (fatty acid hydroxylase superfamily)